MLFLLSFFWYIRTARQLLFTLYLWQLKEYHIGRFLAHFHTKKGKRLFLHPFVALKIFLFVLWLFQAQLAFVLLLLLYAGETGLALRAARTKTLALPVITKKTKVLIGSAVLVQSLFLLGVLLYAFDSLFLSLLLFDLFSLFVGSLVVLAWQPYTVFQRNKILKKAAEKRKAMKNLKVIGITGSYGKTSTKEILARILSKKFAVLKTPEHANSEVGIAQTILQDLADEHEIFVCEMGAYNKGGIKLLADIARPSIGVLTGINEQHLATFGSKENIIKAKYELIEALPPGGVAFFNAQNKHCVELYEKTAHGKKVLYGKEASFAGEENLLGAMAVAKELGMSEREIVSAAKEIQGMFPGTEVKKTGSGIVILDARYSANSTGVLATLEYLKRQKGKKIVVMPCLIELGSVSRKVHEEIGRKLGEVCDLAIITTADEFPALKKGAMEKGMKEENMLLLENAKEIAQKVLGAAKEGDVVLLEGRVPSDILPLLKA